MAGSRRERNDMAPDRGVRVWDAPTRVFHWLLAASFAGAFATGEAEGWRSVHLLLGYTAGGLIAFRLAWGLVGTHYARFSNFPLAPRAVLGYLVSLKSGSPELHAGHNPAGSWAILGMLGLVAASALSGLVIEAGIGAEALQDLHEAVSTAAAVLICLHVAAVAASSLLHRENLVRGMLTGYKRVPGANAPPVRPHWLAGVLLLGSVAVLWADWTPPAADRAAVAGERAQAQATAAADD
jgi:cytochrome b